jgi:thioredoxin reductase (NADPH)
MLAATGMMYREHPAPGIAEHTGAGVYYGAATTEAPAFKGRRVLVIGGGNSAGQGAMYLARYAEDVQIVVRREDLRGTMSQYLIDQIAKTPNIRLRACGARASRRQGHVERVVLKSVDDGVWWRKRLMRCSSSRRPPWSEWLPPGCSRRQGFVVTGRTPRRPRRSRAPGRSGVSRRRRVERPGLSRPAISGLER